MSLHNKIRLYLITIRPIIAYAALAWGYTKNTKLLKQFQNRAIRQIINAPFYIRNLQIRTELKLQTIIEHINHLIYDGLIVRSDTKVTEKIINAGTNLKVIGRAGAGVDNINVDAATCKDVLVLNTPGGNAISACEMTCTLITNLARNVAQAASSMKQGRWDRKIYAGHELYGKTLAIIGLGRIGKEVAIRMQSWGMKTIGFDPIVSAEEAKKFNIEYMTLEQIWPLADYITVHTPLIPATRNLINENVFKVCKSNVRIINVARGGIIDESALLEAIKNGKCAGAALDVYEEEPPKSVVTKELINLPQVVATPHLGASTSEAQIRVAVEISEQFIALTGKSEKYKDVPGVINIGVLKRNK